MSLIKSILTKHTLFITYLVVFSILVNGVFQVSGTTHFSKLLIVLLSFFIAYVCFYFISLKMNLKMELNSIIDQPILKKVFTINHLFIGSIMLVLFHLIYLGGLPGFESFKLMKTSEIVFLRRDITESAHPFWNYLSSFNIKAILPFTLFLLLKKRKIKKYWIYLIVLSIYSFALMQKSYILTLLIPVIIYSLFSKKFLFTLKYLFICIAVILGLVFSANPAMRGGFDDSVDVPKEEILDVNEDYPYIVRVVFGLKHRILVVPGEMVSEWFDHIPADKPFLNGCGYRFTGIFTTCEYHDYARELYPIIRPNFAERGLVGSVNSASFMYDYSNFGKWGLVLAGILLGLLFVFIEIIFKGDVLSKLSLNFFPIFMLSSAAFTTLIASGGWLLIIILYVIFRKELYKNGQ